MGEANGQIPMPMPQSLTLERLLYFIGWPTIAEMIRYLDGVAAPEIVSAREAMIRYMDREWPGKMEEYPIGVNL